MNTTAINIAADKLSEISAGVLANKSRASFSGDAFLQIINAMVANMQQGAMQTGTQSDSIISALLAGGKDDERSNELLANFAAMFNANPALLSADMFGALGGTSSQQDLFSSVSGSSGTSLFGSPLLSQTLAALTPSESQSAGISDPLLAGALGQSTFADAISALQGGNPMQNEAVGGLSLDGLPDIVASQFTKGSNEAIGLDTQLEYASTIAQAKKLLETQSGAQEMSADAQQNAAGAASSLPQVQTHKSIADYELNEGAPEIKDQIQKSLAANLAKGANEFTLKLKPDSLGEITVRLVEKDGGMTLRIITENAQTAKRINSELASLEAAVKPMNVEVHEAVTNSEASQTAGYSQQSFAQGQFTNEQGHPGHPNTGAQFQELVNVSESAQPSYNDGEIDTYV